MRGVWVALVAGCGFHTAGRAMDTGAGEPEPDAPPPIDAAIDAAIAPIDGGFDVAQCPASYNAALPGPSRYRLVVEAHEAWEHSDACARDLPGATHLVVLNSQAEQTAVATLVAATVTLAGEAVWIGAVQLRSAARPNDGWLWLDGTALTTGWTNGEPNDIGNNENQEEQFVELEKARPTLNDSGGNVGNGALCECDGKPIAANAAAAIISNRP
jgi:Lectin C-type domain